MVLTQGNLRCGSNNNSTLEPGKAKAVECPVLVTTAPVLSDLLF